MTDTPSLSRLLSQQAQLDDLNQRLDLLEHAVLLLAKHVGAVGWNDELQQTLNHIRDTQRRAES